MRHRTGLLAAALAAVMTAGASGAAVATAPGGAVPGKKPGCVEVKKAATKLPPSKFKALHVRCSGKKVDDRQHGDKVLAALAKRYGIPAKRLEKALINLKLALAKSCGDLSDPALLRNFARDLGVSVAKAKAVLGAVLGEGKPGKPGKIDKRLPGKPCEPNKPGKPGKPGKPADPGKPGKPGKKLSASGTGA